MVAITRSRKQGLHSRAGHGAGRYPMYKEHRHTFVLPGEEELSPAASPTVEDNSFLFSVSAKAMSLAVASSLDEDWSFEAFKAIRWSANGGSPVCPYCGPSKLYELTRRRLWKCADCETQFSVTTGTMFSAHKLCFRVICMAIAVTVGQDQTLTAADACRALTISYKSAWDLLNRIRGAASMEPLCEAEPKPATFDIGRNRYWDGSCYSTRTWWTAPEKEALQRFIKVGYSPDDVAPALGRTQKSMAHYARDSGISLPKDWQTALGLKKRIASPRRVALAYPYILKQRPEHGDLLALNDLVPRAYPDQMRADICQEMMLAVLEGRVTIEDIKANRKESAWFLKKFYMANYEDSGHAVSLTGHEDEDRNYDEVASSIAAQDWHSNQVYERTKYINAMSIGFQPPTQIEDVWQHEVNQTARYLSARGQVFSFAETASLLENDGFRRPSDNNYRSHAMDRGAERFGLRLDGRALREIGNRIDAGDAKFVEEENDVIALYLVEYGGQRLPVVYNRDQHSVITILETGKARLTGAWIKRHEPLRVGG